MHDKFKKRHRVPQGNDRLRRQIALEAARRMLPALMPEAGSLGLRDASEAEYYAAKRKAAAVLGHTVRPGDLPSDAEIREQVLHLARAQEGTSDDDVPEEDPPETRRMSDHLDRFAIYKMRLEPLAAVKQNPRWHPEGDALYHSLQVFQRARRDRPYDEEFLLAALLHDVGKAIDPKDHVGSGLESLGGTLTPRTYWLIEHHMDLLVRPDRPLNPKIKAAIEASDFFEDLVLLRDLDESGRETGVSVPTVDEALAYLRGLEAEEYLEP
ncbi:MAG: hypothetical protein JWN86_4015 [Planctomycetota bacterium]|nr:hypothetical protein [Planctomycetota bacterium]